MSWWKSDDLGGAIKLLRDSIPAERLIMMSLARPHAAGLLLSWSRRHAAGPPKKTKRARQTYPVVVWMVRLHQRTPPARVHTVVTSGLDVSCKHSRPITGGVSVDSAGTTSGEWDAAGQ